MNKYEKLAELGQSIWYDFIERDFVLNGEMQKLINSGLRGMTSNPTIFEKAIGTGKLYDGDIESTILETTDPYKVYEKIALKDIAEAADLMLPVYEKTTGLDGYVSIEVSPDLAFDAKNTIKDAVRIFVELKRKNIMIKVPATNEGIEAVEELISHGINVNVTLIFSIENYVKVAEAYIAGLEKLLEAGGDISKVASVASFFVSRLDSKLDPILESKNAKELLGTIAVANSKLAYKVYQEMFTSDRWQKLEKIGARPQRLLWASTGTKNPNYADTLYIDELIGYNTVNTVPPATLNSFMDHGEVKLTLTKDVNIAEQQFAKLKELNINLTQITDQLQEEGIKSFVNSFNGLLNTIGEKINKIMKAKMEEVKYFNIDLEIINTLPKYIDEKIAERIWKKDFTIWANSPTEITNRLGWLNITDKSEAEINNIELLAKELNADGITGALLLGMGGSSLAPEVFAKTFGIKNGYLNLSVLDSTHPESVDKYRKELNFEHTLFIVSTKSGGTVETFSFMKYFYNEAIKELGIDKAGNHFIAITDPGSGLESVAKELNFRKIFINDPNIGGRYSALSLFGMVPAGLIGVNLKTLLDRTKSVIAYSKLNNLELNTGLKIGGIMGKYSQMGKDKLTFILSKKVNNFGVWVEQLIAESTGKSGKGILPVDGELVYNFDGYLNDRVFVYIHTKDENENNEKVNKLINAGKPVIECVMEDVYNLAAEFYRWEIATAVSCVELKMNPFDQPNVESAKIGARAMVEEYKTSGNLPEITKYYSDDFIEVYSNTKITKAEELLPDFFSSINEIKEKTGLTPYLSIHAYIYTTEKTDELLNGLRNKITEKYKIATTLGYGPRFLHSTGQLHKGDAGNGLFIQILDLTGEKTAIPDNAGEDKSSISFGVLVRAQALGDRKALLDNGRKVLTIVLKGNKEEAINKLSAGL
ncbi:MAG: bifunctional transaldolase/phosoglucose isomerase [bacterium]